MLMNDFVVRFAGEGGQGVVTSADVWCEELRPVRRNCQMLMNDFVVRFAGEGGQGVVTSAEGLAQASTQVGY